MGNPERRRSGGGRKITSTEHFIIDVMTFSNWMTLNVLNSRADSLAENMQFGIFLAD